MAPVRHLQGFISEPPPGLKYLCWKAADQILGAVIFLSPESGGVSCPCPAVWCDRAAVTGCASLPHAVPLIFHGQHALLVPALFSHKCIQLSLENSKRFLHFCKQCVPLSALGGKNTILIADWISLHLHSRKGVCFVWLFFFSFLLFIFLKSLASTQYLSCYPDAEIQYFSHY